MSAIFQGKWAQATPYPLFTADSRTRIDNITAYNSSASDVLFKLYIVPSGFAADEQYVVVADTIPAGATFPCMEIAGHDLEAGDQIVASASVASVVAVRGTGRVGVTN